MASYNRSVGTPSVSVCVPVYNGRPYLDRCIESIEAQGHPNFEIVFVDDQSTDGSVEVVQEFCARDARARLHVNPANVGLTANWNRCIELARGEWVKFVFQDDWLHPEALKVLAGAVHPHTDLVVGAREYEFEATVASDLRRRLTWLRTESRAQLGDEVRFLDARDVSALLAHWGNWNFIGEPVAVMFRRGAAERVGPFSDRFLVISDYLYWLRLAMRSGFTWVPTTVAGFLVRSSSVSGQFRDTYAVQHLEGAGFFRELLTSPDFCPFREHLRRSGSAARYRRAVDCVVAEAYHAALRSQPVGDAGSALEAWHRHVSDPSVALLLDAPRVERRAKLYAARRAMRRRLLRSDAPLRVLRPVEAGPKPSLVEHYARALGRRLRPLAHNNRRGAARRSTPSRLTDDR